MKSNLIYKFGDLKYFPYIYNVKKDKMTLAEKFNHDFKNGAFKLFDSNGNEIYHENIIGFWWKSEFDSNGNEIYFENSYDGVIFDKRPTPSYKDKIVEIDGKKYQLKEI